MDELNEDQKLRLDTARDILEIMFKENVKNPGIRAVYVEMEIFPRDREEIKNAKV
ncbi:hypothetical protein LCGC14_2132240 [marine sediment metagenome]|uniref:Uncharacterized protein n=1 Tax=marine sediment metagenome TaxID=412755 RepID=A0A0F9GE12_9ZZZZ